MHIVFSIYNVCARRVGVELGVECEHQSHDHGLGGTQPFRSQDWPYLHGQALLNKSKSLALYLCASWAQQNRGQRHVHILITRIPSYFNDLEFRSLLFCPTTKTTFNCQIEFYLYIIINHTYVYITSSQRQFTKGIRGQNQGV